MFYISFRTNIRSLSRPILTNFVRKSSQTNVIPSILGENNEPKSKLSTLYVPGRFGGDVYQIVKPVINIDFIINNIKLIEQSCNMRGIEFDCNYTVAMASKWNLQRNEYLQIVDKDHEYQNELDRLKSLDLKEELAELTREHLVFLEGLKKAKEKLLDVEDIVMPLFQKIPNILDKATPLQINTVDVCQAVPKFTFEIASHVEIGKSMLCLEFSNVSPTAYYLTGKLTHLELATQEYFCDKFESLNYAPIASVDFCKSFIIEAIGLDPYSYDDCIPIKNKYARENGQKLNLVGGASLEMFCAYMTNMNTAKSTLPSRYFALGRRYNSRNRNSNSLSLFSTVQSTNIHCFVLCESTDERDEFHKLFNSILNCYLPLKIPYRTVDIAAQNLNVTESRRKEIELWSPSLQNYVPVAYVSMHGDFISKRLRVTYGVKETVEGYCCIVEGIAMNLPVFIGCIVESYQNDNRTFTCPDVLKEYLNFHS